MKDPIEKVLYYLESIICSRPIIVSGSIFFIAYLISFNSVADIDLFARLAVGRLISDLGYIPLDDPFAFTPRKPLWIDHEWLSGLIFFRVWHLFGDPGLTILKVLAMSLTLLTLWQSRFMIKGSITASEVFWSLMLIWHAHFLWNSTVRCQVFTYLFLSLLLYAIICDYLSITSRYLFVIPALMALWCNLHGGFVVGLGLLLIYVVAKSRRIGKLALKPVCILVLSISAVSLNPYGPLTYGKFIFEAITMKRPNIVEWWPVLPDDPTSLISYLILLFVLISYCRKRPDLLTFSFTIVAAYFAFRHIRLMPIFCFITFVFNPNTLDLVFSGATGKMLRLKEKISLAFAPVALGGFIFCTLGIFYKTIISDMHELDRSGYPVSSLNWLKKNQPGGNLLVDFNNGSYALWTLYPDFRVALDGRYEELYPDSTVNLVADAFDCRKSERSKAIRAISPDYMLTSAHNECWSNLQGLALIHKDPDFLIFRFDKSATTGSPLS